MDVTWKRLLILANSIKKNARCIAGREFANGGNGIIPGNWIRPISSIGEGELLPEHCSLASGGMPGVLDVVKVPLTEAATDPGQPENWRIAPGVGWVRESTRDAAIVSGCTEAPESLWLEAGGRQDRISVSAQGARRPQFSIIIIRPERFVVRLWREFNDYRGHEQRKMRGMFSYHNTKYALSMTDPVFTRRHCADHPPIGAPPKILVLPGRGAFRLCVSLTPPFNGYHYKVIATVFEGLSR